MRWDEEFVAESLVAALGGPGRATVTAVRLTDQPPDFILELDGVRVGVEASILSEFIVGDGGAISPRNTQDEFGCRLIDRLNDELGSRVAPSVSILVNLHLPVANRRLLNRTIRELVLEAAANATQGFRAEREIDSGALPVAVTVIPPRMSGKRIVGTVSATNTPMDLAASARIILLERVEVKSAKCRDRPSPRWLALLNLCRIIEDDAFVSAGKDLPGDHGFERIIVVSRSGSISDITIGD